MNFFVGVVEWSEEEESYLRNFWARAEHMGEALDEMIGSAKRHGILNPIVSSVDYADFDDLPETATSDDDGDTFADDTVHSFPTEPTYRLPYGVVESFANDGYTTEDLTVGYATEIGEDEDDDLIELRALVNQEELLSIYLELIDVLPDISVFWIKLQDDWENTDSEEIYTNASLNTSQSIAEFINRHRNDTLLNGHVTITTFSPAGVTNLSISDHKMIVVLTYDEEIAAQLGQFLEQREVHEQYELVGMDHEFHHWHYRHPQSRDRQSLVELLKSEGFELWVPEEE